MKKILNTKMGICYDFFTGVKFNLETDSQIKIAYQWRRFKRIKEIENKRLTHLDRIQ
eukprot:403356378